MEKAKEETKNNLSLKYKNYLETALKDITSGNLFGALFIRYEELEKNDFEELLSFLHSMEKYKIISYNKK